MIPDHDPEGLQPRPAIELHDETYVGWSSKVLLHFPRSAIDD